MPVCGFVDVYSGFTPPPTRKSKRQRRIWGVSKSSNVPIKREKAVKNLFGHDNIGCVGSCPILLKT